MRDYPTEDRCDQEDLERLNPKPWMVELLRVNPEYACWGPHEDYMLKTGEGWDAPLTFQEWSEFAWELDHYNECVNFYFEINRDSEKCVTCGSCGDHPDAQWISESFYDHSTPFKKIDREEKSQACLTATSNLFDFETSIAQGHFPSEEVLNKYPSKFREFCEKMAKGKGSWNDDITQHEVDVLVAEGRLHDLTQKFVPGEGWKKDENKSNPTAIQVNSMQNKTINSHDAINRCILVRSRCKSLGVPQECPECKGFGHTFTEPAAHLSLVIWMLHPRKGCSRGIEIQRVSREDLTDIKKWLSIASERNSKRFSRLDMISKESE